MVPCSIAVIPDGNRRFSLKSGLSLEAAYLAGFKKVEESVDWAVEAGVKSLAYWALSLENIQSRSQWELGVLFALMRQHARKAIESKEFDELGARVKFFGRTSLLPDSLQDDFKKIEASTADNSVIELNIGVAYGGKDELLTAAKKLAEDARRGAVDPEKVDERKFSEYFYLQTAPDLVIRTGGVQRLSGFMPWHTGYSELYFSDKLWPEFQRADFQDALAFFASVKRNFGR